MRNILVVGRVTHFCFTKSFHSNTLGYFLILPIWDETFTQGAGGSSRAERADELSVLVPRKQPTPLSEPDLPALPLSSPSAWSRVSASCLCWTVLRKPLQSTAVPVCVTVFSMGGFQFSLSGVTSHSSLLPLVPGNEFAVWYCDFGLPLVGRAQPLPLEDHFIFFMVGHVQEKGSSDLVCDSFCGLGPMLPAPRSQAPFQEVGRAGVWVSLRHQVLCAFSLYLPLSGKECVWTQNVPLPLATVLMLMLLLSYISFFSFSFFSF